MTVRDGWCTPEWLTSILPIVTLDPCSNAYSTVRSHKSLTIDDNGLSVSWTNESVYVNPPFSNILPWAIKAAESRSFMFLVNIDPTTKWWRALMHSGANYLFLFRDRIQFVPPPGVIPSKNSKSQALVCSHKPDMTFGDLGTWWRQ